MLNLTADEQAWLYSYREALDKKHPGAVKAMLIYGSKARRQAHAESDVDVLLIVNNDVASLKRELRWIGYMLAAKTDVLPSILAYTEEEWESRRRSGSTFRSRQARCGARRMNRSMVLAEWNRARESLRAAETLSREALYSDAISRAYYAILHGAKAALQIHEIAAESHPAVRRMFGLHLVKSGEMEPEWSAYLTESLDDSVCGRL